jgi:predicted negative regulator of RcsB-dependent stress response
MVAAGGMVAYAGVILVLIAIAIALGDWWNNLWLATLVVGLVTLLLGWTIFNSGKNQLQKVSLVPRKTLNSINSDAKVVKEKLS